MSSTDDPTKEPGKKPPLTNCGRCNAAGLPVCTCPKMKGAGNDTGEEAGIDGDDEEAKRQQAEQLQQAFKQTLQNMANQSRQPISKLRAEGTYCEIDDQGNFKWDSPSPKFRADFKDKMADMGLLGKSRDSEEKDHEAKHKESAGRSNAPTPLSIWPSGPVGRG